MKLKSIVFILGIITFILIFYLFDLIPLGLFKNKSQPLKNSPSINAIKPVQIISKDIPVKFTNETNKPQNQEILQKRFKTFNETTIRIGLNIIFGNQNTSQSAGFLFSNGVLEMNNPNHRAISVFYFLPHEQWVFGDYTGEDPKYYGLLSKEKSKLNEIFILEISNDGTSVEIISLAGLKRKISLNSSLYDTTNNMKLYAQLGPYASVSVAPLIITAKID